MQSSSKTCDGTTTENKDNKRKKRSDDNDEERLRLLGAQSTASPTVFLPDPNSHGVGKFTTANFHALKALSYLIMAKTKSRGMTWGEGPDDQDPRRRMYGFLPHQREALIQAGIQIQKYGADGDQEHETALRLASVDLVFGNSSNRQQDNSSHAVTLVLDDCVYKALQAVTRQVRSLVPQRYQPYATLDELVAVQPNLHNGAGYLPAHLDFPRHDGFGVLIVTIGIRGSGTIVLIDDGDDDEDDAAKSFCFSIQEGEAYILCGNARNKCVHGVLCDNDCQRETLNLRYGLHSKEFANEEIDRHWPD